MKRHVIRLIVGLLTFTTGLASSALRFPTLVSVPVRVSYHSLQPPRPVTRCENDETRRLKSASSDQANRAENQDLLGDALLGLGCYVEAVDAYAAATEADPTFLVAYQDLANTYNALSWYEEAIETAKQGLRIKSDDADLSDEIAFAEKNLSHYQAAARAFHRALRSRPEDAYAHATISGAYLKFKRYDEALVAARRGAELGAYAQDDAALGNAGLALLDLEHNAEAISALEQARTVDPEGPTTHVQLAYAYELAARTTDMLASYEQAASLATAQPDDYLSRAWANLFLDNGAAAASEAQQYLDRYGWRGHQAPYAALLAYIGYQQLHEPAEANRIIREAAGRCNQTFWRQKLFRYLLHQSSAAGLMAAATNDDELIESRSFIGLDLLFEGRANEARGHLQWVHEHGVKSDYLYGYTLRQLNRL